MSPAGATVRGRPSPAPMELGFTCPLRKNRKANDAMQNRCWRVRLAPRRRAAHAPLGDSPAWPGSAGGVRVLTGPRSVCPEGVRAGHQGLGACSRRRADPGRRSPRTKGCCFPCGPGSREGSGDQSVAVGRQTLRGGGGECACVRVRESVRAHECVRVCMHVCACECEHARSSECACVSVRTCECVSVRVSVSACVRVWAESPATSGGRPGAGLLPGGCVSSDLVTRVFLCNRHPHLPQTRRKRQAVQVVLWEEISSRPRDLRRTPRRPSSVPEAWENVRRQRARCQRGAPRAAFAPRRPSTLTETPTGLWGAPEDARGLLGSWLARRSSPEQDCSSTRGSHPRPLPPGVSMEPSPHPPSP